MDFDETLVHTQSLRGSGTLQIFKVKGQGHWVKFETIRYALCHRKFSYMINQKFMKLCTLQDPNMKMCTLVVYPGPSSFPRVMSLRVVFQICFGSIKLVGTRGVLVPRSGQLSYSIYVSMRDSCVQQYLQFICGMTQKQFMLL